jgi:hypothetical protein
MFGLAERFVNAKFLEISRGHWLGDQTKLESLIRFCDKEIKHPEIFWQIKRMMGTQMALRHQFLADPNDVAREVLGNAHGRRRR